MLSSLKGRLGWGLSLSLVVLFSVQFIGLALSFRDIAENRIASRLSHDAESVFKALTVAPGTLSIDPSRIDVIFERPFSGHYFRVTHGDQVLRSRSLWDYHLQVPDRLADPHTGSDGQISARHVIGPQGQDVLLVARRFIRDGDAVVIVVGEDLSSLEQEVAAVQWRYGLASLFILLLLVVVQQRIVGRTLAPLERVRRELSALERGERDTVQESGVPDEVRPLVAEVNHLLQLMGARVARSRNALGNLAHALKTPLTLLTQLSDRAELSDSPEIRHHLTRETDKIGGLVERELKRARLAGRASPGQRVALARELEGLASVIASVYRDKGLNIRIEVPEAVRFPGDREDVLELFGNLLDNAGKWAKSQVTVGLQPGGGLTLTVADDGPGCAPEQLDQLTQRGVRLDESAPGHGLGLAIAREVVESYGGSLTLGRCTHLGGFLVTLHFPVSVATHS